MTKAYQTYDSMIEKHLENYILFNYPDYIIDAKHPYIIDKSYHVSESLLPENRLLYKKYMRKDIEIHSPGNLKSSQLMAFDLFLPYIENTEGLKAKFQIYDHISSISFEEVFSDYTHVDVFMKTEHDEKIICEVKYSESCFDRVKSGNILRSEKFQKLYQSINQWMEGDPVEESEFMANYQLYRNLYHAFSSEKGKPGYFIVIYPKDHPLLEHQFNEFYERLEVIHKFKHMDRIKKTYIERMAYSDSFWGKYIVKKDKILEIDIINKILEDDHRDIDLYYQSAEDLPEIQKQIITQDQLNIMIDIKDNSLIEIWKYIQNAFEQDYQVVHRLNKKYKHFIEEKSVNILF